MGRWNAFGRRKPAGDLAQLWTLSLTTDELAGTVHSLKDLGDIPGITADVYERIEPAVTLYSQSAAVSPALAPAEVLRVLPGFDEQKIEETLSARASESEAPAPNVTGQTSLEGHAFTIKAAGRVGSNVFVRYAVGRITGSFQKPYDILRWESGSSSQL